MYNVVETDVICPNCGEGHMICEEPEVIKSNTETYAYSCPICGFAHVAKSDEDMKKWIKNLDKPIEEEILKEPVQGCGDNYDCLSEAPHKCLNEKCGYAEVFKNKLLCLRHSKWFDITPVDLVNHPPHYESGKFECIDVMVETQGKAAVMAFCLCNAFKYLYRHNNKNGVEDIKKAKWYIDKYLELEASNETAN